MKIQFRYSLIFDLVFHVLAHMQVNNASNLYSLKYIESFSSIPSDLINQVSKLQNYYNKNFERLCMINFLPVNCNHLEDLDAAFLSHDTFTSEDIQNFITPFLAILKEEFPRYKKFWENRMQQLSFETSECEKYIADCVNDYQNIFSYFNKNAEVYFSLSLTCNGRGIFFDDKFSAVVPYPVIPEERADCFFQLFHEYTHQFTDRLFNHIEMTDGSHDLSERLVILADYFIFKKTKEETAADYLRWIAKKSGNENNRIDESIFFNIFYIPSDLMCFLNNEIAKIFV